MRGSAKRSATAAVKSVEPSSTTDHRPVAVGLRNDGRHGIAQIRRDVIGGYYDKDMQRTLTTGRRRMTLPCPGEHPVNAALKSGRQTQAWAFTGTPFSFSSVSSSPAWNISLTISQPPMNSPLT